MSEISKKFFDLWFIGSVGFDDHLIDSSLASILFASASFSGGCSAGAYQQIVKNMRKKNIFCELSDRLGSQDIYSAGKIAAQWIEQFIAESVIMAAYKRGDSGC